MKKYQDGDYQKYTEIQIHRAKKKWSSLTFKENIDIFENILIMAKKFINTKGTICCMGIRGGNEYTEFVERYPDMTVYGIDIVPDVVKVGKNCYAFDFAELPIEWADKFDMIYSNSIDHSFDVTRTVGEWYRITKDQGYLLLTMSSIVRTDASDRYSFTPEDVLDLFSKDKFDIVALTTSNKHPVFNVVLRVKK